MMNNSGKNKKISISEFLKSEDKQTQTKSLPFNKASKQAKKVSFDFIKVAAALIFVLTVAVFILPLLPEIPGKTQPRAYKGVVEMWNVETFEGGSGSRSSFLTRRAAEFEKKNTGLYVHVTNLTYAQAEQKLAAGDKFDLASFSLGTGNMLLPHLSAFDGSVLNISDNFLDAGTVTGKLYGVPFYAGAYGLFARKSDILKTGAGLLSGALTSTVTRKIGKNTVVLSPLTVGFNLFNSPLSALAAAGAKGNASPDYKTTQYSSYELFVGNRTAVTLLGTQRDMFRLANREEQGKTEALEFVPLSGYTDLVQYAAVSVYAGQKRDACVEFIEYLTSEKCQRKIIELSLFPVVKLNLYTDERYVSVENLLYSAAVPNVFSDSSAIARLRGNALSVLGGGDSPLIG